ncbi:ribonuclease H-like domain-containing protein [Tanacetum coccineum]
MRAGSSRMASDININLYNSLFEDATKRQRTSAPTSELGQYMATNFLITLRPEEFTNFDILAWWKEREIQFPILSAMARDLLTVQASTVASESAFSISGRIISERRSRLTPESVEVCVCLKDYLDGVDRVQHETSLEGPILEDVEETIAREEVDLGISPPNTELDEVDVYVASSLVLGYCRIGRVNQAWRVFDVMCEIDECGVNEVTYTVLLHGLCEKGIVSEAFRLTEEMAVYGCRPTTRTYNVLTKAVYDIG